MSRTARMRMWTFGIAACMLSPGFGAVLAETGASGPLVLSREARTILRRLPIQHNGRQKPFDSFARETLARITGSPRFGGEDPPLTVLSMVVEPERWQETPLIAVPFRPLREALGAEPKTSHLSYNEVIATRALMRRLPPILDKQRRDEKLSMLEQETLDAYERFVSLSFLFEQRLELVPPAPGAPAHASWLPILQPLDLPREQQTRLRERWTALVTALRARDAGSTDAAAQELAAALRAVNPSARPAAWRLGLEVFYHHAGPFRIARILYALAALALLWALVRPARWAEAAATAAFSGGAACHLIGILMRVVLGGRPPVSNFYETMLWLPLVAVALAAVFARVYRTRPGGGAAGPKLDGRVLTCSAAVLAALTLVLADHLPLDSSISPVVAVLRSNLWLTVHVLTIVASYGALALAAILAHLYGALYLGGRAGGAALEPLELFLYRIIQVGVVLLAGGIMLGAVWANASWGRYWGWDPKETWALITLLWFLALLHGRFAGWLRGVGVSLATIGGFFLLLMTYYGVSFYLVGLHSYAGGHAKPLPPLLIAYLIAEALFLCGVGAVAWSRAAPRPR